MVSGHLDRMIAASMVLYIGLGIVVAIILLNYWKTVHS
jgi:hypothetical protein